MIHYLMFFLSRCILLAEGRSEWNSLSIVYRSMESTCIYYYCYFVSLYLAPRIYETSRSVNKSTVIATYRKSAEARR